VWGKVRRGEREGKGKERKKKNEGREKREPQRRDARREGKRGFLLVLSIFVVICLLRHRSSSSMVAFVILHLVL